MDKLILSKGPPSLDTDCRQSEKTPSSSENGPATQSQDTRVKPKWFSSLFSSDWVEKI